MSYGKIYARISLEKGKSLLKNPRKEPISGVVCRPEDVLKAVSKVTGISAAIIMGKRRNRQYVEARQYYLYICREHLKLSYALIAKTGGWHHTTCIYMFDKMRYLLQTEQIVVNTLNNILFLIHNINKNE